MEPSTERLIGELIANVQNVGVQLTDWRAEFNRLQGHQDERIETNTKAIRSLEASRTTLVGMAKLGAFLWTATVAAVGFYIASGH